MLRWVLFIAFYFILGFYTLQALKTASRFPWVHYVFIVLSMLVLGNFIFQFSFGEEEGRVLSRAKSYAFGFLLTILTFMLITVVFLFSEDIFRLIAGVYHKLSGNTKEFSFPQRRRFLSLIGMGIAAVPFGALLFGHDNY